MPTFGEIVERSLASLERRGRVSRTALRLEFDLDDATLQALCEELVVVLGAAEHDGAVLVSTRAAGVADEPPSPAPPRDLITVLLGDLAPAPELQALDADARSAVTARFHAICTEVARRLHGRVRPWVSDGVAIFFGHPHAHEDDALRAVRCGWEILRTVEAAHDAVWREFGVAMPARLGIATGPSGDGVDATNAFGDMPRIAGRVQELGAPGHVTVDEATRALTAEHFGFEPHGEHFSVGAPLDAAWQERHAPAALVGRSAERALLHALAERAAAGTRSAVLLRGPAGIGKSRLVDALGTTATALDMQVVECHCTPYHRGGALHPLLEGLRRHWQLEGPQASARLAEHAADDRSHALLSGLLGIDLPRDVRPLPAMSPGRRRREALAVLVETLGAAARRTPLLLVVEDLHWADPTTVALLDTMLDGPRELALLLCLTARSDFRPHPNPALQRLDLRRLERDETLQLIELVAAGETLPDGIAGELAERANGSPLLAEELTRTTLATEQSGSAIAATLYGCLMTRLDRDSTARSVARLAATIGREFDVALLEALGQIERSALDWGLERLVQEDVIVATAPGSYAFRHALLQDAARSSLRREALREHNLHIARTLLASFPEVAAAEPERIARHYEYGGDLVESVRHWRRAGLQALGQGALQEATGHFERGLQLVSRLPDRQPRRSLELDLRGLGGLALASAQGWSAAPVTAHLARADELSRCVDAGPQVVRPLLALAAQRLVAGRINDALALARAQIPVAKRAGERQLLLEAECQVGSALVMLGRHREALPHLARAGELCDPAADREHAARFGRDPAAISLAHRGLALACRDDRDGARYALAAAADLLRGRSHPFSEAWVRCAAATAAHVCDERAVVLRESASAIQIATEEGFDGWLAHGLAMHGWARVSGGEHDEGLDELRRGVATWTATGAVILRPFVHGLLADALGRIGEPELGLHALDEALSWVARGERWYEPELHRLRAELLLAAGDRPGAMRSARSALSLARRTSATGWERRAAAMLARCGDGTAVA